jgi:hypothetical protein
MLHSEPGRRRALLERDGFRCRFCGGEGDPRDLVVARIGVLGGGAVTGPDELVTACPPCAARAEWLRGQVARRDREQWFPATAARRSVPSRLR